MSPLVHSRVKIAEREERGGKGAKEAISGGYCGAVRSNT